MAIRFNNQSILTAPSGVLLGAKAATLSLWFKINGGVANGDAIIFGNQYVDTLGAMIVAGTGNKLRILAVVNSDGNYLDKDLLIGYSYNLIMEFSDSYLEGFLNGFSFGKVTSNLKGTLGGAGAKGKPFQIGPGNNSPGNTGLDITIEQVALWKEYLLPDKERKGIRDRSIDIRGIAPGQLVWYLPMTDGSQGINSINSVITVKNDKYNYVDSLNYVPPGRVDWKKIGPSGQVLSLLTSDLNGNLVNCLSVNSDPTLIVDGVEVQLKSPVLSGSPRIEYGLGKKIDKKSVVMIKSDSGWAMTSVGEVGGLNGVVENGLETLLPPRKIIKKKMLMGTNIALGGMSVPVCPFRNRAKVLGDLFSPGNKNFALDDYGYIKSLGSNGYLSAFLSCPLNVQGTTDIYSIVPDYGLWKMSWKGDGNVSMGSLDGGITKINPVRSLVGVKGKKIREIDVTGTALQIGIDGLIEDLVIERPGVGEDEYFDNMFLKMGRGYSSSRFMDGGLTNNSSLVDDEDLPKINQLSYCQGKENRVNVIRAEHWTGNNYFLKSLGLPILLSSDGKHKLKEGQQLIINGEVVLDTNDGDKITLTGYMPIVHIVNDNQFAITRGPDKGGSGGEGQKVEMKEGVFSGSIFTRIGWPIELMISYCNKQNSDLYWNVPHAMTNDCIKGILRKIGNCLKAGLRLRVSYSNETWNSSFLQSQYCACQGALLGITGDQWYSKRAGEIFKIAMDEFGKLGRGGDLKRVLESQGSFFAGTGKARIGITDFDEWAIAPYFWFGPLVNLDWTVEQLMDLGEMSIQFGGIKEIIDGNRNILKTLSKVVDIITYENGPGYLGFDNENKGILGERSRAIANHERMKGIIDYDNDLLNDNGVTVNHDYMLFGVYGNEYVPGGSVWAKNTSWNGRLVMAKALKEWMDYYD